MEHRCQLCPATNRSQNPFFRRALVNIYTNCSLYLVNMRQIIFKVALFLIKRQSNYVFYSVWKVVCDGPNFAFTIKLSALLLACFLFVEKSLPFSFVTVCLHN
eukprot:TRINITY_DN98231_c0_g1_i1.p1 TRINITY_DN98231_c0_g1~~TRINITY_DN98231_c0_g1_i1.p1  ORF type:complete len:103 (-),score=3.19 TRINITY_DN98231_c0_g1_i1:91-399(-)